MSDDLRKAAEARLKAQDANLSMMSENDVRKLAHELQVHQVELEMQNEEIKRAQSTIEASREKYSDLYDFSPVGYVTLDKTGIIIEANLTFTTQAAMERSDLLGKPLTVFIPPSDSATLFNHLKDVFRYGRKMSTELQFINKEGLQSHILLESISIEEEGAPPTCRTSVIDISRRVASERLVKERTEALERVNAELKEEIEQHKRTGAELLKAKEAADAANEAKSVFLACMSHEIRTPMTAIIGMIELLSDTPLNDEQQNALRILTGASESLFALINDLLDLARIESGHLELDKMPFSVDRLLSEISAFMDVKAKEKGLHLNVHIEPEMPLKFIGDPNRLRQILYNLISNAVKFTRKGRIEINARKLAVIDNVAELEFSVSDTGIGIPQDKQGIIFELFTQVDLSTMRNYGGMGLGTTISKKLVQYMDGNIWLESKEGEGSTFYFTVKLKMDLEAEPGRIAGCTAGEESVLWTRPLKILIVEDSIDILQVIKLFFSKTPHIVDTAENGSIALKKFKTGVYDLLLMDMEMPVMDGYAATREIRKWEAKENRKLTPIIALTAHALKEYKQMCIEAGCTAYLTKPIKRQSLMEVIYKYTEKNKVE